MQSQLYPILLNLLAAFIGAAGQYSYKLGGVKLGKVPIYLNWELFVGIFLFIGVMILFVASFKLGGKISITYPVYATTFIWGTLLGVIIDKEPFNLIQVFGIGLVVIGVSTVAYFAPR